MKYNFKQRRYTAWIRTGDGRGLERAEGPLGRGAGPLPEGEARFRVVTEQRIALSVLVSYVPYAHQEGKLLNRCCVRHVHASSLHDFHAAAVRSLVSQPVGGVSEGGYRQTVSVASAHMLLSEAPSLLQGKGNP